jgi:hypothetical protein|tara:strand:- start:84 stop:497 length:414 start_codon:yes stop_codon:yes gene_type:complete
MSKTITYDFSIDTLIAVDAEVGTDPDTLLVEVAQKIIQQVLNDQLEINFDKTFDGDTGEYRKDWKARGETYSEQMQEELEPLDSKLKLYNKMGVASSGRNAYDDSGYYNCYPNHLPRLIKEIEDRKALKDSKDIKND